MLKQLAGESQEQLTGSTQAPHIYLRLENIAKHFEHNDSDQEGSSAVWVAATKEETRNQSLEMLSLQMISRLQRF